MSGTRIGGKKAAATNKERYGDDFYEKNGSKGGKKGKTGGFYANPELARIAGAKGGRISRRGKSNGTTEKHTNTAAQDLAAKVERPKGIIGKIQDWRSQRNNL